MRRFEMRFVAVCCCLLFSLATLSAVQPNMRAARKLDKDGNYKDALAIYAEIAVSDAFPAAQSAKALEMATLELRRLNRVKDLDALIEKAVERRSGDWPVLFAAAKLRMSIEHFGYLIGGEFQRGGHRGGGRMVNSYRRDRVSALRLFKRAAALAESSGASPVERYGILTRFANAVLYDRGYREVWRLQILTDLDKLPELEKNTGMYYFGRRSSSGAPVEPDGTPVFIKLPKSFDSAKNDGERWRFLIAEAAKVMPSKKYVEMAKFASFLQTQFGVQTMAFNFYRRNKSANLAQDGPYALHTLSDDETIAKLAVGLKRFKLPKEYNYIRIYREIAASNDGAQPRRALEILANIFTNRRQYAKAADIWRGYIKRYGPGRRNRYKKLLDQIIGGWGRFEPTKSQTAGLDSTLLFRFRNASEVEFTARKIDVERLLGDVRKLIISNPKKIKWSDTSVSKIGYALVNGNRAKYLGAEVAEWKKNLTPAAGHFDKTIPVKVPMKKGGAYLVSAKLADGNTSNIVLWLNNAVLVKKTLNGAALYFVADAETGAPLSGAELDFFGYQRKYVGRKVTNAFSRRFNFLTKHFKVQTGADGFSIVDGKIITNGYSWLVTAKSADGTRMAYLGFQNIWFGRGRASRFYNRTKTFLITDRPVYRPKQTVKFKFWTRRAKYDLGDDESTFARQAFKVEIRSPRGEKIYSKTLTADKFGGVADEIALPADATLGNYRIFIVNHGGGAFRVEEYRKPEFEVSVEAPKKPVALGDSVSAVIRAKYYFGAPVANAKVKYKVLRTPRNSVWFPPAPWDWLYGPGYWWFGCKRSWYPGWNSWGCVPPHPWWFPIPTPRPEVVMENEVPIGPDGTVTIKIDTAVAKYLLGDIDQNYAITAEVVDQSRRMIVGSGTVVAAVKPFKVTAWLDRGFLSVGDTATANFAARTVLGDPVSGICVMKLLKITYDPKGKPTETTVASWTPDISPDGVGSIKFKVAKAGQYRVSCVVTDSAGRAIEGGCVFTARGPGKDWKAVDGDFRFNDLEIVNDKREYAPGDKANLMISTNRGNSFVLLFPRTTNGGRRPVPIPLRLDGKTAFAKLAITKADMPNIFVEALTVSNGRVHSVVRELVVPPEKRVLNVELIPDHAGAANPATYKPGEKARLKVKVTDFFGKPVAASVTLAVYDKSVEYISGGSNVPNIKPFFWKWRRRHSSSFTSNTRGYFGNIIKRGNVAMRNLGLFGAITADSGATAVCDSVARDSMSRYKSFGGGRRYGGRMTLQSKSKSLAAEKKAALPMAASVADDEGENVGPGGGEPAKIAVRSNFADTAYWNASITPDANGVAEIAVPMPENLTTWVVRAWSVAGGTKVGEGRTEIITSKDFILRLIAPRFLVEGDEAVLSAIVHNRTNTRKTAKVAIKLDGGRMRLVSAGSGGKSDSDSRKVVVSANGEARVEWRVKALLSGEPKIVMTAVAGNDSDGMEVKLPVLTHGIIKQVAFTGSIPASSSAKTSPLSEAETLAKGAVWCDPNTKTAKFAYVVPADRRLADTSLTIRYSPTLAGAMIDALPYLVSYPYGCTEQTLNRFLPTVITRDILRGMKVNLDDIRKKRANLNAAELGDPAKRAAQWKKYSRDNENPVFNDKLVDDMIAKGVARLRSMRNSDGGWGWFSGYGERSYPHTTALVVRGLVIAKRSGVNIPGEMIKGGVSWLESYQNREIRELENAPSKTKPYKTSADNLDALVLSVLVEAGSRGWSINKMTDFLYRDRTRISVYSKCLLALAVRELAGIARGAESATLAGMLKMLLRNIEQFLVENPETQTAYLDLGANNYWWCWYGSENETMAAYLRLLSAVEPRSRKAAWLVKYLLDNRKHGARWSSTRDTALCVEALADYIRATGEGKPDMTVEIKIDGKVAKTVKIDGNNLFSYDDRLVLGSADLAAGKHLCEIRVKGSGPLYLNAYLKYFSLEKFITKTGLRIKTRRRLYKLIKIDASAKVAGKRGQVVGQKVEKYKRIPLANLAEVKSGDLVEVELLIDSDNDYEYIMIQDNKPAGLEAMENRSGYNGNELGAYVEFRDSKVCFFVRSLARGSSSVSYRLRAETPGRFSALPAVGTGMYAPELRSNSDEFKLKIAE